MAREAQLHIVLYQPEIPQNTGNIGRTCVAADCKLWLVRPLGFRLDDSRLRRAGLDYWQFLEWEVVRGWSQLAEQLPLHRCWFFSAHAPRSYWQAQFVPGDVLVFGGETQGLPPDLWHSAPERCLAIPAAGRVRSLNLSNAVAVGIYEALRQWAAD